HPHATEIYFCYSGGGTMHTPERSVDVKPGSFVVHPPGELHEYANGPQRTLLFRVRYGSDMLARHFDWRGNPDFKQRQEDAAYFHQPQIRGSSRGDVGDRKRRWAGAARRCEGRRGATERESMRDKGKHHVEETQLPGNCAGGTLLGCRAGQAFHRPGSGP